MVPVPESASIEELNVKLLEQCNSYGSHKMAGRKHTVEVLHETENDHLLPMPEAIFSNLQTLIGKVDKYATVIIDKNRYSVPTSYAGQKVSVLLGVDTVDIFAKSRQLASHKRLYGNNKWQLNPDHYLDLLIQRPMAFNSARPIRHWQESWPGRYCNFLNAFVRYMAKTRESRISSVF